MGRPKKQVDEDIVAKLAGIGCTVEEIAIIAGVSKDTLERRFAAVIEKGRAELKQSLKHKQVQIALGGDKTMLIWLGKQYLGQSDKNEERAVVEHVIKGYKSVDLEKV